ncbi:MAG: 2,3-butanediol dehydrogenase [Propionibacteriaceae bacterium]|nr:2,3-butanediol dehydrogenase [Propionibacteriaceae bacterium]
MRALVYYGKEDVRVEDIAEPGELGPHEVRIRPFMSGICGTDLHEYLHGAIFVPTSPHPLTGAQAPQVLGHEFGGEVLEIGPEVTGIHVGDRASIMPLISCGKCYHCRRGNNQRCELTAFVGLSWRSGGLSEQAVVYDYQVAVVPDSVSDIQAAIMEPASVAAHAVEQSGMGPGDTVLITGTGPIGALTALYCYASGAGQIIMSEPNPARRTLVEALGVATILDPTSVDVPEAVRGMTGGRGADVAVECSGSAPGLVSAMSGVRPGGTVSQVGLHTGPATIDPIGLCVREINLIGSFCYPVYSFPRTISLVATGRYPLEKILTGIIDVSEVVDRGFNRLVDPKGDALKILVKAAK